MKMETQDFIDLVFNWGSEGDTTEHWEELSDRQKEIVACAWQDVEINEKDNDSDEYCPESYAAVEAWYQDFCRNAE